MYRVTTNTAHKARTRGEGLRSLLPPIQLPGFFFRILFFYTLSEKVQTSGDQFILLTDLFFCTEAIDMDAVEERLRANT